MLAQILALMAAAAPAQGAAAPPAPTPAPASAADSHTVSPVTVSPSPDKGPVANTVNVESEQQGPWGGDFTAIWPAGAYNAGVDGHVILNCLIDAHGLAESCKVAKETPVGKKLGEAALELRPTFKLKPATDADGQPVSAVMALNVTFKAQKAVFDEEKLSDTLGKLATRARKSSGTPEFGTLDIPPNPTKLTMRAVTMMDNPVWADAASFDDLAAAYPATAGGVEGYVAAHCRVERSGDKAGALRDCQVIKESPTALGFAKAGLALAAKFRADPSALARLTGHGEVWVDIQIRLPPPTPGQTERTVTSPRWIVTVDPKILPQLFPPQAAAKGLSDGRGVARCHVAGDGSLTGCVPEDADPNGLGFAEVAARVASKMRMNLWSADGAPVDGGVVHVPIHLSLAETN